MSVASVGMEVVLCVDCMIFSEYYQYTNAEHAAKYYEGLKNWVGNGIVAAWVNADAEPCTEFSKSPCELCGTQLHGERYSGIINVRI